MDRLDTEGSIQKYTSSRWLQLKVKTFNRAQANNFKEVEKTLQDVSFKRQIERYLSKNNKDYQKETKTTKLLFIHEIFFEFQQY